MKLALIFLLILPLMTGKKKSGDHERRSVKSLRAVFRDRRQFGCSEAGETCKTYSSCCSRFCCEGSLGKRCARLSCDDIGV
uniref:Conotoxin superfamily I1 n=1 Tax=Conus ermineus TaxID=55423 RepID=A0A346CIX2_CONER|nr:conotoxin precursor superfamily I1 [Conus ermineus]